MLSTELKAKLLPYQIPHVESIIYSIKKYNRCMDASDTGTGKTFSAIATAYALGLKPLIICPKSVINSWKQCLDHFGAEYYGIANYESMQNCKMYHKNFNDKIKCPYIKRLEKIIPTNNDKSKPDAKGEKIDNNMKKKKSPNRNTRIAKKGEKKPFVMDRSEIEIGFTYEWSNLPADIMVIFDEAHRCKNLRTLNNVLLYTLGKTTTRILILSATLADKPENFVTAGFILGLYKKLRDGPNWIRQACEQSDSMAGIHDLIFPEYACRMKIKDLGKLFPDNQIVASCYTMDCAKEIQEQYKEIEKEIERLKRNEDASGCALARILYCRMRIEHLKAPTLIEEAKKYLAEGNAVAIFVNFTQTLKYIADELKTECKIFGEQSMEERNKVINDFNTDAVRVIVCNIQSGGVGISLHDTRGVFPRVALISPGYSAQSIIQALGRTHRANGKTAVRQRIIFAADTIEEDICENMKEKIKNIAMLNDMNMDSYIIEGLTDDADSIGVDSFANMSEFDKLFLRVEVLNIKKERLAQEMKETDGEIEKIRAAIDQLW